MKNKSISESEYTKKKDKEIAEALSKSIIGYPFKDKEGKTVMLKGIKEAKPDNELPAYANLREAYQKRYESDRAAKRAMKEEKVKESEGFIKDTGTYNMYKEEMPSEMKQEYDALLKKRAKLRGEYF